MVALRSLLSSLPPAETKAARFILQRPDDVINASITQLSTWSGVGEATILRLCNRLNLRGYTALKIAVAQAGDRDRPRLVGDVGPGSTLEEIVERVLASEVRDIEDTGRLIDLNELGPVIESIKAARQIVAYGAGPGGFVALDFAQKLSRLGLGANGHNDPHLAITAAALMSPQDVAVGFSYSGRTKDTLQFLSTAKDHAAVTIAITGSMGSPVARVADRTILTAANEGTFRTGATSSRIAQLVVVDVIFVALAADRFEEVQRRLAVAYTALEDHRV
jgi:DNA-binding MurR/RpiR family transcriptional regulator